MISIDSEIQHSLGQQAAIDRMQSLVASLSQRFPEQVHQVTMHLSDHQIDVGFAAYGYNIRWSAEVFDDVVQLHGEIPDSAAPFRNKMEATVVSRVEAGLREIAWSKSA